MAVSLRKMYAHVVYVEYYTENDEVAEDLAVILSAHHDTAPSWMETAAQVPGNAPMDAAHWMCLGPVPATYYAHAE